MNEIVKKLEKRIKEEKDKNDIAFNIHKGYDKPILKPKVLNIINDEKDELLDIDYGYLEGFCTSDNRPYRIECWGIADIIMASVYFSTKDKERCSKEELIQYLEDNNVIIWLNKFNKKIQVSKRKDEAGKDIFSINVKLKEEDTNFAKIAGALNFYNLKNKF